MVERGPHGGVDHFSIADDSDFFNNHEKASSSRGTKLEDLSMDIDSTMISHSPSNTGMFSSFVTDGDDDEDDIYGFRSRKKQSGGGKGDGQVFTSLSIVQPAFSEPPAGATRYPCKARNVSSDHTNATAYLELPPHPCHGYQLFCSHRECKESGRAFRWCQVCQIIVAKRNFMKRHSHGLLNASKATARSTPRVNKRPRNKKVIKKTSTNKDSSSSLGISVEPTSTELSHRSTEAQHLQTVQAPARVSGAATSSLSESLTGETVAGLSREGRTSTSFEANASHFSFETNGFLHQALELSSRKKRIFTEDEDASIAEIGSLKGLDEADIDSIFD